MPDHLPGCTTHLLSELPDGAIDLEAGRYTYRDDIHVCVCFPTCPVMAAVQERAGQLANKYGWGP